MTSATLHRMAVVAVIVTFVVIVLGAYVRLSHAGLGCPDWPGCYGQLTWPAESGEIEAANTAFPERPVDIGKAWKEMVHRYLAGFLVLLVVAINVVAWRGGASRRVRLLAGVILALILFQAALGMWTVTLKLKSSDHRLITRSLTLDKPTHQGGRILRCTLFPDGIPLLLFTVLNRKV